MKTTARIIAIASLLTLAGAMVAAWGAESVVDLISQGEAVTSKTDSAKTALDQAVKNNDALVAEGKQIQAQQQQLQANIDAYKKQNDDVKQQTVDYKAKCDNKQLTPDEYKACKEELAQINASINAVNAKPASLNKQQNDFLARAKKYNEEVKTAPKAVSAAQTAYRNALISQFQWLDKARVLVASPAFAPYAKKAGCPDVKNPAKTDEAGMKMSDEILTCLKKVAGSN
jgi:chromosome segregation ATPase